MYVRGLPACLRALRVPYSRKRLATRSTSARDQVDAVGAPQDYTPLTGYITHRISFKYSLAYIFGTHPTRNELLHFARSPPCTAWCGHAAHTSRSPRLGSHAHAKSRTHTHNLGPSGSSHNNITMAGVYSSAAGQEQLERDLRSMQRGDWVHKRVRKGSKLPGGTKAGSWVDRWLKLVGGGADGEARLEWNKKGNTSRKTTVHLADVMNLGPGLPENVRSNPDVGLLPPPPHTHTCFLSTLSLPTSFYSASPKCYPLASPFAAATTNRHHHQQQQQN